MVEQELINWLIGGFGATIGFLVHVMWSDMKELTGKVAAIDVLVAGSYVKREEFDKVILRLFEKLDKIEETIHRDNS